MKGNGGIRSGSGRAARRVAGLVVVALGLAFSLLPPFAARDGGVLARSRRRSFLFVKADAAVAAVTAAFHARYRPRLRRRPPFSGDPQPRLSTSASAASASSPSDGNPDTAAAAKKSAGKPNIVYQKVVRAPAGPAVTATGPSGAGGGWFLASLVHYLQEEFRIPEDRLPMPYKATAVDSSLSKVEEDRGVLVHWDSPLSPSPDLTSMYVEVIGIMKEHEPSPPQSASPTMAMVVVRKRNASQSASASSSSPMPPMLHNLFHDSEKRILRALDAGLDDFAAGNVAAWTVDDEKNNHKKRDVDGKNSDWKESSESLLAEVLVDDIVVEDDGGRDRGIEENASTTPPIDAVISNTVRHNDGEARPEGPGVSTKKSSLFGVSEEGSKDFAVAAAAAKASAAARGANSKACGGVGRGGTLDIAPNDYAVHAAQRVSRARSDIRDVDENGRTHAANHSRTSSKNEIPNVSGEEGTEQIDLSSIRPPILDPSNSQPRAFMTTISTPSDYAAKKSYGKTPRKERTRRSLSNFGNTASSKNGGSGGTGPCNATNTTSGRKLNIWKQESELPDNADVDELERVIVEETQDTLTELTSGTPDMTPEELLENVMKFGEEQKRKDSVGGAFVSGAFEKAKELLREQKQLREDKLKDNIVGKVSSELRNQELTPEAVFEEVSPEEEMRKMFEAGERIAEGRIAVVDVKTDSGSMSDEDEKTVDSIVSGEKSISNHARVLDEELAELEIRINKSPDEELDGTRQNGLFDVFSGPEVYNPNVDPLTAVNWPGALPGTRDQSSLPKELDEAVNQAKFAAEVLSKLVVKGDPGAGVEGRSYYVGERELSLEQVENLRTVMKEGVEIGLIDDPLRVMSEVSRLQMLLDELQDQPTERIREIASNYKDLLLSDHFVPLIKQRLGEMAERDLDALRRDDDSLEKRHARERELLGILVGYAQLLLKETRALGAELEAQQLEVIRSICKVAMDPTHSTEEETAVALSDAVRDMRPLLDDAFVAYLKYAVAEEEGRLARAGLLDDPEHSHWLMVLQVVQQGVYSELARGINRYIDHIWYILRMETPAERRMLLKKLTDVMPSLDVRPFVQVIENIAGSLGDGVSGEFDSGAITALGEMTNKILQLRRDVKELLPPERIALMSRDADEWAEKQRKRLKEQRRLTHQRLESSRQTEHLDGQIESLGRRGDIERIE